MGLRDGASCGSVESGGQRRPVVAPVGDLREPAGVGRQLGQLWAPPVGPGTELLASVGDGGPPEPQSARAVEHDAGGSTSTVAFAVPATDQVIANPLHVRLDGGATDL